MYVFSLYMFHNNEYKESLIWIVLSVEAALIACYFICERLFGITPSKLLTGMIVVDSGNASGNLNTVTVMKRTLIRFLPFESFSFLSTKGGWHEKCR